MTYMDDIHITQDYPGRSFQNNFRNTENSEEFMFDLAYKFDRFSPDCASLSRTDLFYERSPFPTFITGGSIKVLAVFGDAYKVRMGVAAFLVVETEEGKS
ncbi:unnamed protein product [Lepeophtheirus salmonis]|uniref:(salmon louse) hypothetical protein n=1 Tax=Lepeophtheirus salmonis TaxID=72036 RepID=A0A7R8D7P7_LEPSM|nr:unnamed protein product [Lepeophtheirus salmonis]CAF3027511.1 unnamed protein product [Lepeophtheirus salmonis]